MKLLNKILLIITAIIILYFMIIIYISIKYPIPQSFLICNLYNNYSINFTK